MAPVVQGDFDFVGIFTSFLFGKFALESVLFLV